MSGQFSYVNLKFVLLHSIFIRTKNLFNKHLLVFNPINRQKVDYFLSYLEIVKDVTKEILRRNIIQTR